MARYILRNISKNDINLGDLRYKIPAGKSRDLLSRTARLLWKDIEKSRTSGSIAVRLGKTLIEIKDVIEPLDPIKYVADPSTIFFPRRVKSSIVLEMEDFSEEIQKISLVEDDELLKELGDLNLEEVPLILESKNEKEIKTKKTM